MVSDERALASWLSSRDAEALAETFAARGVSPSAPWHDFFDAAAGLLDAASVDRALARLPRRRLIALRAAAGRDEAKNAPDAASPAVPLTLALTDADGAPYDAVAERLAQLADARPDAFEPDPAAPPLPPGNEDEAAERAFTTAGALADVLLACLHAPLSRTGTGAISAVDRKRLVESAAVETGEQLEDLVDSASAAGLAEPLPREWVVTTAGERWLASPTAERWATVVAGLARAVPDGLRDADGAIVDPALWARAYPLDADWVPRAERLQRLARRWGLLTSDGGAPEWTRALLAGEAVDPAALARHLPAEIDRVYLQADLTAIAPGPLAPALDLRLRRLALRESRAQASTYRFTAHSIGAGMTEGETADSMREFLGALSLTGIPQPLAYLIESTAARHGQVRVRDDDATGRTRVEVVDPSLRDAIAVDQALRPLGLLVLEGDDALSSRVGRHAVYWALADARYPVVALGADGAPEAQHRRTAASTPAPEPILVDRYAALVATLRSGHGTDGEEAWLERELEQAVRARATIMVAVRLPDGLERTFTLEASGLGGGRLRGRDRSADIERTLPVSSIVSVRPSAE